MSTPVLGSVLQIMPATGTITFTSDGETWTSPLIGYAVVVRWVADDNSEYETDVVPLFLEGGIPANTSDLRHYHDRPVLWEVQP